MKLQTPIILSAVMLLLAGGCALQTLPVDIESDLPYSAALAPTLTPEPTAEPTPQAIAILQTQAGNLRSGPGMNYPVVAVMARGESYPIVGSDDDGFWWQLCCVSDPVDETGATPTTVWVAASIVDIEGDTASISSQMDEPDLGEPLFDDDFTARWRVDYRCNSDRCEVSQCSGEAQAQVRGLLNYIWLEIDRSVTWDEGCGDDTLARFQVHRYSGQDRYVDESAAFFDRYWVGANPGDAVREMALADGQTVQSWCTGPQSIERQMDENWTVLYDGEACYDIHTGMLLTLSQTNRWLFTGQIDEQSYERAFFGDTEYYELELESTNARLSAVE